jgi:hypothetical protein
MPEREVRYRIVGDASSAVEAAKQSSAGLNQFKDSTQAAGKESEKASLSHKDMHKAMHAIGEKAPAVGLALKAMVSGPGAALAGLLIILGETQKALENLDKSLSTSEWESYAQVVENVHKSLQGSVIEAAAFAREMANAAKSAQTAAEKTEALAKVHSAQSSAMDKIRDAQKDFELAQADQIKDPEERKKRRAEIEFRYAIDKKQRDDADAKLKITEEHRLLANEEFSQTHRGQQIAAAKNKADSLPDEKTIDAKIAIEESRKKAIEKELEEKEKRLQELESRTLSRLVPGKDMVENYEEEILRQQVGQLRDTLGGQGTLVGKMTRARPGQIIARQAEDEEVKRLEAEQLDSVKRSTQLRKQIPADTQIAGIESNARGSVLGIGLALQVAQGNIPLSQAGLMAESAGAVKPNPHFAKLPQDMAQLLNDMGQFVQAVPGLKKQIDELRGQIKNARIWAPP